MQATHFKFSHNYLEPICFRRVYTTYWMVATWRRDRGGSWHVGWVLLILVTILLSLWTLYLVKDKIFLICHVTTQLKCHVTLWKDFPHPNSNPCWVWGLYTVWKCGNITFFTCQETTMSKCHVTLWVYRLSESGDITFFICHVTTWSTCHVNL